MWEVIANLRALIRASTGHASAVLTCGSVQIDTQRKIVTVGGKPVTLRPKPYQILEYLMHHKGEVVGREELLDHVYGWDNHPETNTIEVFVKDIRNNIGVGILHTRRGFGYTLEYPDDGVKN